MRVILTILSIVIFSVFGSSCVAQKSRNKKGDGKYTENLNKIQPKYSYNLDSILLKDTSRKEEIRLLTNYSINRELNPILDSISILNKDIKYIRGYRVLVFSGNSQDDALKVRTAILEIFEEEENKEFLKTKVDFIYHQPMFRIKVGEYSNRLQAVRMTEFLKKQEFDFGEESEIIVNPLVVPDNLEIRK